MYRDAMVAEHEAAHIVVGCALGLKLRKASLEPDIIDGRLVLGYAWFGGNAREGLARTIMYCAGAVWESRPGGCLVAARADLALARKYVRSKHDLETATRMARELLDGRRRMLARVASELCDRDLNEHDVEALVLEMARASARAR